MSVSQAVTLETLEMIWSDIYDKCNNIKYRRKIYFKMFSHSFSY